MSLSCRPSLLFAYCPMWRESRKESWTFTELGDMVTSYDTMMATMDHGRCFKFWSVMLRFLSLNEISNYKLRTRKGLILRWRRQIPQHIHSSIVRHLLKQRIVGRRQWQIVLLNSVEHFSSSGLILKFWFSVLTRGLLDKLPPTFRKSS